MPGTTGLAFHPLLFSMLASMNPTELFEDWLTERENDYYDPLSREAALPYAFIWKKWIDWLGSASPSRAQLGRPPHYLKASQEDALAFLTYGPSPASKRNSSTSTRRISPVTRLRYGEVLTRVYAHALMRGLVTEHPFTAELLGRRPTERERGGQVLPPGVFEAMRDAMPAELSPLSVRDRAIVLLLLECGLTSGELRTLEVAHIRRNKLEAGQYLLRVDGPRQAQRREVSTTGQAGPALQQWLAYRDDLGKTSTHLFRSTKLGTLAKIALFSLVYRQVLAACNAVGVPCPGHVGPGVIRNTVIVRRLRAGLDPTQICKDLGIKDTKTLLRGLRHHLESEV